MQAVPSIAGIAVAVAAIGLTGCHRHFTNRNLEQLRPNISQKEVETILGHPDRTEKVELELETQKKTMAITRYYYQQNGQTIVLHFQNGLLLNQPNLLEH
jgi:quinolinate synthase